MALAFAVKLRQCCVPMSTTYTRVADVMTETAPATRKKRPTLLHLARTKLLPLWLRWHGVEFAGKQWLHHGFPSITRDKQSRIVLGDGCAFGDRAMIVARGGGALTFGRNCFINTNGGGIIAAREINIGADCLIADHVVIMDDSFHPFSPNVPRRVAAVNIGRNVWINPGVRILPGVTIGDHSVIGAGAVVTRDIPARSFAAGLPARVVSTFACADDWVRG